MRWLNANPWPCTVGYTNDEKALKRQLRRMGVADNIEFRPSVTRLYNEHNQMCLLIVMPPKTDRHSDVENTALLVHEAVHVMQFIKEEYSRNDPIGDESEAYFIQSIVQQCLS